MERIDDVTRRDGGIVDDRKLWKVNGMPFWLRLNQLFRVSMAMQYRRFFFSGRIQAATARAAFSGPSCALSSRSAGPGPARASQSHPWSRHGFASSPFDVFGVARGAAARSVREFPLTRHDRKKDGGARTAMSREFEDSWHASSVP